MTAAGHTEEKQRSTSDVLVVLCTCPDTATAERLAGGLVGRGLAACVNILPQIRSIYRWKGETQDDAEVLMIAKTTRSAYAGLETWLTEQHPYDVPEVLALSVAEGSGAYLQWVVSVTEG